MENYLKISGDSIEIGREGRLLILQDRLPRKSNGTTLGLTVDSTERRISSSTLLTGEIK